MKWILYLLVALIYNFKIQANVQDLLDQIPLEDKEDIRSIFKQFIYKDHFGYTILGDKPISLSGHFTLTPWQNILSGDKNGGIFWKKWSTWKKYSSLFSMKHFLLIEEKSLNFPDIKFVILINKTSFLNTLKKHKILFDKILGFDISPQNLLEDIESGRATLQATIQNSEILWGVLLGYGEHNACLYERRDEICRFKGQSKLKLKYFFPSVSFQSLEEEKEYLWDKLQSFEDQDDSLSIINSVNFAADLTHPETKLLKKKYAELKKKVIFTFSDGDILEIAL
ncbi:hypothetical protein, partial [Candidatus Protochlamydia phocaeensis]|uniref:hypothetical protein n=1 Tax=Candidatus Protochlamydia phocaeensis TaxID=1414722 RepID=UPI000837C215